MLVYVDDILIASAETYATNETGKFLESVYQMTDFGWPKDFLGFERDFDKDDQQCAVAQLAERGLAIRKSKRSWVQSRRWSRRPSLDCCSLEH